MYELCNINGGALQEVSYYKIVFPHLGLVLYESAITDKATLRSVAPKLTSQTQRSKTMLHCSLNVTGFRHCACYFHEVKYRVAHN